MFLFWKRKKTINDDDDYNGDNDGDDEDDDGDGDDDDAKIKQLGKALDLSPSPVNEVSTLPPCTLISSLSQRK